MYCYTVSYYKISMTLMQTTVVGSGDEWVYQVPCKYTCKYLTYLSFFTNKCIDLFFIYPLTKEQRWWV